MAFGIAQLRQAPVAVLPEFSPPLVEVQTEALGLSAEEVEALLTVPMEADLLNGVAWLDEIRSQSVPGLSSILLIFEPGTDPIRARQMVQERLTETFALPNVSKPPTMLQPLSSANRVMMVKVTSDELSPIEMSVLARWNIKPTLMGVPGVANVAIWGQRERQLQVQVDPERLRGNGVTLEDVIETTGEALWFSPLSFLESSTPGTGGWIDTPNQRLGVRHLLPITTPEDLAKVSVVGNESLSLGDVAEVVENHQPLIGDAILDDGQGLLLVIEKFPAENTLEVTRQVEETIEALKPGMAGITFDTTIFRPANYIETTIDNLSLALIIGAVLVVVLFFLLLYNWRTALIGLVAIPLSLVAAGLVLYLRGAIFNTMVFAGLVIALSVVIDDAIVDVEKFVRRLRQHRQAGSDKSAAAIILETSLQVRSAIMYATLIIVLAVVPVFFLDGLAGAFSQSLIISYILALLASIVVALTVTPALSLFLLRNVSDDGQSPLASILQGLYNGLLAWTVRAPLVAIAVAVIVTVVGLAVLPFLRQSLLPTFKETTLVIPWEGAPGTSRPAMNRITAQAINELRSIPGITNVGSTVGRAITGDQIVGVNSGELWVSLDPAVDYDVTVAAVQAVVSGYPGLEREVRTYLPDKMGEVLVDNDDTITVRIFGHDFDVLRDKAEEVRQVIAGVNGVAAAQVEDLVDRPQLEIEVDLVKAQAHGISPGDVRRTAATLLSGLEVGALFEESKVFEVVVWGVSDVRSNLTDIQELMIDTPQGDQITLGEVADIRMVPAPIVINRDSVSRFIDVTATVSGRNLDSIAADIKARLGGVAFPFEFHAEVINNAGEQQAVQQRLLGIVLAALIGIFLLLQAAFRSWQLALVGFLTLPMALAGGLVATVIAGGVFSLGSLLGLLAVLALAARNGIVMVNHFQDLEQREGEAFGAELVLRGVRERLMPILITALATGLAFLPMVIFGNIIGLEIVQPMAVVILGGLVTSTLLNLVVIPALYLRYGANVEVDLSAELFGSQPAPAGH
jgi:CzcA family heavy metal efflux pump